MKNQLSCSSEINGMRQPGIITHLTGTERMSKVISCQTECISISSTSTAEKKSARLW